MAYDVVFLHPPSIYDFRRRPVFPGPIDRTVRESFVFIAPPIGLISIADLLDRSAYKTRIFNLGELMFTDPKFDAENFIKNIEASIFGIDLHFCVHSQGAIEIAKLCKSYHENASVVLGGLTASRFHTELVSKYEFVDAVVRGEAEYPMLTLAEKGLGPHSPNLTYMDEGKVRVNESMQVVEDLDAFDFSRFDLLEPHRKVINVFPDRNRWYLPLCRGCLYNCITCGGSAYSYTSLMNRTKPAFRSPQKIIEDISRLHEKGIDVIGLFQDPRMGGPRYCEQLFNELRQMKIDVDALGFEVFKPIDSTFVKTLTKIPVVDKGIILCPESGDEKVRRVHGRKYSTDAVIQNARLCLEYGVAFGTFFMVGLANETYDTIQRTLSLCGTLLKMNQKADRMLINVEVGTMLLLDPGSLAFDLPEQYGYILNFTSFEDYYKGLSEPCWKSWISYETRLLDRNDLATLTLQSIEKLIEIYVILRLMPVQHADMLTKKQVHLQRYILDEFTRIENLPEANERMQRLKALHNAVVSGGKPPSAFDSFIRRGLSKLVKSSTEDPYEYQAAIQDIFKKRVQFGKQS